MTAKLTQATVQLSADQSVSALVLSPEIPRAAFVFAHGAGAGMSHSFMTAFANGLADHDVATLRFQFPYMERGSRRPDAPATAHAAIRAAVDTAIRRFPGVPLFAGGKSFGGRMTSQAQAAAPLSQVLGLVFVGFPLHPAGKPGTARADHLAAVDRPMLFLQGTRDELADLGLMRSVVERVADRATLKTYADADHSFCVRASSGTDDASVLRAMTAMTASWMARQISLAQQGFVETPPVN